MYIFIYVRCRAEHRIWENIMFCTLNEKFGEQQVLAKLGEAGVSPTFELPIENVKMSILHIR